MFSPYYDSYYSNPYQQRARAAALARERALEEQRQRELARSRYFPDGYYDGLDPYDDYGYGYGRHPYGYVDPRERAYLEAQRRQELEERRLRELEIQRQKEEEEARLRALAEQRRREYEAALRQRALEQEQRRLMEGERLRALGREQQRQRRTSQQSQVPHRIPVTSPRSSPAPQRQPSPPREATPLPVSAPTEEEEAAATRIQTFYRIQRALRSVRALHAKFVALKNAFVWPAKVDYVARAHDEEHVSLPFTPSLLASPPPADDLDSEAKLAYTPNNVPLHGYTESLNRLLVELDGVESFGRKEVRQRRKEVVREVEQECTEVETTWRALWKAHLEGRLQEATKSLADKGAGPGASPSQTDPAATSTESVEPATAEGLNADEYEYEEDSSATTTHEISADAASTQPVDGLPPHKVTQEATASEGEAVQTSEDVIAKDPDTQSIVMADPDAETRSVVMADADAEEGWENVGAEDADAWGIEAATTVGVAKEDDGEAKQGAGEAKEDVNEVKEDVSEAKLESEKLSSSSTASDVPSTATPDADMTSAERTASESAS